MKYIAESFMHTNIMILVNNRCDGLTDTNECRAIALSNVETIILERIILTKVVSYCNSDVISVLILKKRHCMSFCADTQILQQRQQRIFLFY